MIWYNKMPPKIPFFAWTTSLDKILTINNLKKCTVSIIDWYCMCKKNSKIVDHHLLHYETTRAMESYILQIGASLGYACHRDGAFGRLDRSRRPSTN